jgi:hypothetical protein
MFMEEVFLHRCCQGFDNAMSFAQQEFFARKSFAERTMLARNSTFF